MNIAEIITRLEELHPETDLIIENPFGLLITSEFCPFSWRGSYKYPAIEVYTIQEYESGTTVEQAIEYLRELVGKTMQGYKGGEYKIRDDLELFLVGDESKCGNSTVISEIDDDGYCYIKEEQY